MATQKTANIIGKGGGGFLRLIIPTVSDSDITDFNTNLDLTGITALKPTLGNARKATEYENVRTIKGVDVRVAKNSKTQDAVTGENVASSDNPDQVEFSFYANDTIKQQIEDIIKNSNQPVIAIWSDGDVAGNLDADYHLLGYLEGNLEDEFVEGVKTYSLTLKGGVGFTESTTGVSDYITVYKTTPGTITPDAYDDSADAVTLEDAQAADLTKLLSGEIVKITRS